MKTIPHKEHLNNQFQAETGGKLSELDALANNTEVNELVSQKVGEKIPVGQKKDNTKRQDSSIFAGFGLQISNILGKKKPQKVVLPSIIIQKKRVKKSLEKEKSKLLSQANKIKNSRNFRAYLLEELIMQIRYIQNLLDSIIDFTAKRITELYKKYYLKVG